ncbi:radical SAM protein [Candidatus Poribacteria bacterium]|nr:radical SAM protein [Candidatus Poribacteria bacterium]
MRVAIIYPPMKRDHQYPLLGQNRQFRYSSSDEVKIFPLVPATMATLLKQSGNEVLFLDGINSRMDEYEFDHQLKKFDPQIIVIETKAPIIKRHWAYIDDFKNFYPDCKTILIGDHVTFYPKESMQKSKVDFCVTGGDYDISVNKLVNYLEKNGEMPKGIYYYKNGRMQNSGNFELIENLDELPFIDRNLTKWDLYGEAYLHHPCAYILTGRGCGGCKASAGQCKFCIWQHAFWRTTRRLRSPSNVAQEIKILVKEYKVCEIFDDNEAGAVWNIDWLKEFYQELTKEKLPGKFIISSNARADSLTKETCKLLKKIGYRLLKVGLETGNNETLKRLHKQETVEQIIEGVKEAKKNGLIIMLTTMMGYPWEGEEEAKKNYEVAKELMLYKTHFGDSLQSSVITPYPGTPIFEEALDNGWFNEQIIDIGDYENYDMSKPILKSGCDSNKWCQKMWKIHYEPVFLLKSFLTLRSLHDLKLAFQGIRSLAKHVKDFT